MTFLLFSCEELVVCGIQLGQNVLLTLGCDCNSEGVRTKRSCVRMASGLGTGPGCECDYDSN